MRRYKRSQLNAISRYYTEKGRNEAIKSLKDHYDIDYDEFCMITGYKGSPVRMLGDMHTEAMRKRLEAYRS